MAVVPLQPLRRLVQAIFVKVGCPNDEAERIAYYLSRANLTGHDSHGVIRVPRYVDYVQVGTVYPGRLAKIQVDGGAVVVLDAEHGFGQTVGPQSTELGIERARRHGTSMIALRHAGHLGRIGDYAEIAAEAGMVSLHFVNVHSSLLVAPFGGRDRRTSTNPIAIGVPSASGDPFILDFATSMVAEGKCLVARQGGKAIPSDALVGDDGVLTDNTDVLYGPKPDNPYPDPTKGPGALRTFGEHKGSGLSLACDLLAGALTGSGANCGEEGKLCNGMFSIYITPKAFGAEDSMGGEVKRYIEWIKASRPTEEGGEVLTPGDRERALTAERTANGLPMSDETWQAIQNAGLRVGLSQNDIDQLLEP